ncbi:MAG: DMT family transporter [Flavobacteriales bacterium]|nr:DMT family transporter [Flavobacteriales bacterium]
MRFLPYLLLTVLALIWGSSFILMKEGLKALNPVQMAAFRISISGAVFWPIAFKHIKSIKQEDLKWAVLAGFMGNGIPAFLFAIAQTRVSSSMAGALNALTPLFTLLIAFFFTKYVLGLTKILGVLTGLAGALILILLKSDGTMQGDFAFGFLIVLATLCYGGNINLIKNKLSSYRPLVIASVPLFSVSVICVALFILSGGPDVVFSGDAQATRSALAIVVLAILGTSVGLVLFNRLIQLTGAVFSSSVTYLIPVVALFIGWIDGEQVGVVQLIGLLLILTGIYLINMRVKAS